MDTAPIGQVNVHASPEPPFRTGGGCWTVPSTSQLSVAGTEDVVQIEDDVGGGRIG